MIGGTASLPKRDPAGAPRALGDGAVIVLDEYLEALASLGRHEPFAQTAMADALPRTFLPRYDLLFAKGFVLCVSTVVWKLQSPDQQELARVAEELALNASIGQAAALLETHGQEVDLGDVYELAFQDLDFEFLLEARFDGIEDSNLAQPLRLANLRFEDWFTPFANVPYIHPYAADARRTPRRRRA